MKAPPSRLVITSPSSPIPTLSKNPKKLSKGKGEAKEQDEPLLGRLLPVFPSVRLTDSPIPEYPISNFYPICGICLEQFQVTPSSISASLAMNSSASLSFGLRLTCPGTHTYCASALTEYIKRKLDQSGAKDANTYITVLPIACPECPIADWGSGIQDDVAERIFVAESMSVWVQPISKQFHDLAY